MAFESTSDLEHERRTLRRLVMGLIVIIAIAVLVGNGAIAAVVPPIADP